MPGHPPPPPRLCLTALCFVSFFCSSWFLMSLSQDSTRPARVCLALATGSSPSTVPFDLLLLALHLRAYLDSLIARVTTIWLLLSSGPSMSMSACQWSLSYSMSRHVHLMRWFSTRRPADSLGPAPATFMLNFPPHVIYCVGDEPVLRFEYEAVAAHHTSDIPILVVEVAWRHPDVETDLAHTPGALLMPMVSCVSSCLTWLARPAHVLLPLAGPQQATTHRCPC